jgi:hypothetical protein
MTLPPLTSPDFSKNNGTYEELAGIIELQKPCFPGFSPKFPALRNDGVRCSRHLSSTIHYMYDFA